MKCYRIKKIVINVIGEGIKTYRVISISSAGRSFEHYIIILFWKLIFIDSLDYTWSFFMGEGERRKRIITLIINT